jgi:hypothetical protein
MEVAPPLLPAGGYLRLDGGAEDRANLRCSGGIRIRSELEPAVYLALLEPAGEEVDEDRARGLGLRGRHLDRDPPEIAQRKTLFSLSKKPSSSR